jgi:hypothetical protein
LTLGAVLIIDWFFLSMGSGPLVTAQAVASLIGLAEILLAVGDNLQ